MSCLTFHYSDSLRSLKSLSFGSGLLPDEPHPNTIWNLGHVDGLDGLPANVDVRWPASLQVAYLNGHRSGCVNRQANERAIEARAQRRRRAVDEAWKAGYDAALADAAPVPPVGMGDDCKGSWLDGFGEGESLLIARDVAFAGEMRELAAEMDSITAGSPWY